MPSISLGGSAFLVNQQTAESQFQAVTTPRAGGFAAFWSGPVLQLNGTAAAYANSDIKGRLFNSDGTPAGDEFTVNSSIAGIQFRPNATTLSDGHLLVVWQDGAITTVPSSTTTIVRAQELGADGSRIGSEFVIAGPAALNLPNVAALGDGGFVVSYYSSAGLVLQRYNAANIATGSQITIANSNLETDRSEITMLANGNIVVTYTQPFFTGGAARVFDTAGTQVGAEIVYTISDLFGTRVTALSDGGFALTANFSTGGVGYSIRNADGSFRADGLIPGGNLGHDVVATSTGDFVVAYFTDSPESPTTSVLEAQLVRGNGNIGGAAVAVNTLDNALQSSPVLSRLPDGDIIVTWIDQTADGSGFGIKGRVLDVLATNSAPVAVDDYFVGFDSFAGFDANELLTNDTDGEGDTLVVTAVGNARSGSVSLANGFIIFTPNPGYNGPAIFEYTVSDGAGGTATATATLVVNANDSVTVRGAGPHLIDVLANDFLPLPQSSYSYGSSVTQPDGSIRFVSTSAGLQLSYTPLQTIFPEYFSLLVGQTSQVDGYYYVIDPATGTVVLSAPVTITLEGWAQLGGSEADNLVGTALADHLSGGTGAANTLAGGDGDDWYTVQAAGDVIIEAANQGIDTVRTSLAVFQLADNVENLQAGFNGAAGDFSGVGNSGNNSIIGGVGNDVLSGLGGDDVLIGANGNDTLVSGTGNDTLVGGIGNDGLFFGAFFSAADIADGGPGTDQVGLQGDYSSGLTLGASSAVGVEQFVLLPGSDTRFGAPGNEIFSYNIITGDAAIAAGQQLVFQANTLRAGENFTLDARDELDGLVFTYAGQGTDRIIGSQTGDAFFFGSNRFNAGDVIDGQGGVDQIGLQGDYSGANAIVLGADQIISIEGIVLLTNSDSRFGGVGATPFSYDITTNDANVAAGQRLFIQANTLTSNEVLRFNGSAEADGSFSIFSGNGADVIIGSQGSDTISGRGGADALTGGGGNDTFLYTNLTDSTAAARDMITDFAAGDRIDLSRIDAITGGTDDAFTLIGSAAFGNIAGQLRFSSVGGGVFAFEGDVNGDGTADFAILVTNVDAHPIGSADFIL